MSGSDQRQNGNLKKVLSLFVLLVTSSCATYYQSNFTFNQEFESGQIDKAFETLQKHSAQANGKKEFLYLVNNGLVLSMMGRYEDSNTFFEKAFLFGEDYRINYLNEAASYLTNPNFTSYKGEDHEHLLLLYYKAMNYLKMNNIDDALVECRRLNIRLQQLTDRYKSKNKYEEDAFIHVLMGLTYEVDKDYNNAFIAYRNALRIYKDDYQLMFDVAAPKQLKTDLLRTAWLSGLKDEFEAYKDSLKMPDYVYQPTEGGELIFFWHNGLSPVKAEWGVNFTITHSGNWVYFSNPQLGLNFPFDMAGHSAQQRNGLARLEVFRVAFPKYIERPDYYSQASITADGNNLPLQLLEDVNKIAFKCLQERMGLEFSKALLRVALKKLEEYEIRKQDRTLGSLVGVFNALTERADTRNWQTLPHDISYCRVPLKEGQTTLTFTVKNSTGKSVDHTFTYNIKKGQTLFHTFSSLETSFPNYGYSRNY
ncbi:MAG: hypothetical protein JST48_13890 [Bacteroidetes bacterium]|nr:hypothetical protein [Bacteroidota bacterium]